MSAPGPERGTLDAALAYAAVGWPVFPVTPGGKTPAFPAAHPPGDPIAAACQGECGRVGHGFHDATTDPETIREWWGRHPDRNVGIRTGDPGPDVIDVDIREDGSGFAAYGRARREGLAGGYQAIVRTPSAGMHLYYPGTAQRSGTVRGQHLDFRAQGGYVVAPPSQAAGAQYVVVKHEPSSGHTVDWAAIKALLEPQAVPERPAGSRPPVRDGRSSVDRLVRWVAARQAGDRNFPLFYAAKQAELAGQLDDAAVERFVDAARQSGLRGGEREARRTIASAQRSAWREAAPRPPFARPPQRQLEAG